MTATVLITQPRASGPPEWNDECLDARAAASADPTFGETVDETVPLVGVVPLYGPPVVLLAGPWLLLSLMLAGPFALMVTFVVLLAAAATLVGLVAAALAAPYLLVRRLRSDWAAHASVQAPSARLVAGGSRWGAA
jgi:hypothetical protein